MKILRIPLYAMIYLSIASVLAEAAALAVVWSKGNLNEDSLFQILAVANDVDLHTLRRRQERANSLRPLVYVSMQEVEEVRNATALDMTMREIAIDKGLIDIREISEQFNTRWDKYKRLKDGFDVEFGKLRQGAKDQAVKDVQRQLESLSPRLAKSQILKIMDDPAFRKDPALREDPQNGEDPEIGEDAALQFVVAVFKGMPIKNRKRIMEEFRVEDTERLHEILKQIRKGEPDVGLFRRTRRALEEFN